MADVAFTTPAQLQQFQNAGVEADRLRQAGKTVSASASFSDRVRLAESRDFPAELTFDSFETLKIEALPEASTLTVIPICDLCQNLPARTRTDTDLCDLASRIPPCQNEPLGKPRLTLVSDVNPLPRSKEYSVSMDLLRNCDAGVTFFLLPAFLSRGPIV
jgi:hypothetical protein